MIGLALEVGTANTKIGFIGESEPRLKTESIHLSSQTHRSTQYEQDYFIQQKERIFGYDLNLWRDDVKATPIFQQHYQNEQQRLILNKFSISKEGYLKFIEDLVNEMRAIKNTHNTINEENSEYALLVSEPTYLQKYQINHFRQTIAHCVFEDLRLSGLYFLKNSVASAYSEAKSNAIVIDSGHNFTSISRVVDGYCQKSINYHFGGNIISHELENCLSKRRVLDRTHFCLENKGRQEVFNRFCKFKEINGFKQAFGINRSEDIEEVGVINIDFPNQSAITIGRDEIVEPFTQYQNYRKTSDLYFPQNYASISRAAVQLLEQQGSFNYIDSIILTGGNMLFSNLSDRIADQIERSLSSLNIVGKRIVRSKNSLSSSWVGCSVAGSADLFHNYWCTAAEYQEHGINIINKKCPI